MCRVCIRVLFISSVLDEILTIALMLSLVVIPNENIATTYLCNGEFHVARKYGKSNTRNSWSVTPRFVWDERT